MFAIKAPVVKVVAAAQNQKSEKKAMCVFASTRSTLDFEFCFFYYFITACERERAFLTGILGAKEAAFVPKNRRRKRKNFEGRNLLFLSRPENALCLTHIASTRALFRSRRNNKIRLVVSARV